MADNQILPAYDPAFFYETCYSMACEWAEFKALKKAHTPHEEEDPSSKDIKHEVRNE